MLDNAQNMVEKGFDKLPDFNNFQKNPKAGQFYFFLIIFTLYFIYNEFIRGNDCDKRLEAMEKVLILKDKQIEKQEERIGYLEKAFDVQRGIVNVVSHKADSLKTN